MDTEASELEARNGITQELESLPPKLTSDDLQRLSSTLESLNAKSKQCTSAVEALTSDITDKKLPTKDGISLLEVKNHLLLQYLISLTGLIGVKVSGSSIKDHTYLNQLVETRTFLEKIKPIEGKLKYQIDKIVNAADGQPANSEADPLKFRANLDDLQNDDDDEDVDSEAEEGESEDDVDLASAAAKSGVYKPPKIAPQYFDEEESKKPAQQEKAMRKKSLNQAIIRELQEEYLDTPVEVHNMGDAYAKQLSREVKDRQRYEENYMTRLPVTKQDKHRSKTLSTIGLLGDEITDFRKPVQGSSTSKGKKRKYGGKGKFKSSKKFKK